MTQDVFSVLADPTRRAILEALQGGELAVGDLVDAVGASQPTVSKHLRILRETHVVAQRADGQKRFYTVQADALEPATAWLASFQASPTDSSEPPASASVVAKESSSAEETLDPLAVAQREAEAPRGGLLGAMFRRRRR